MDEAELKSKFGRHIDRLDRMLANYMTMNEIEFSYHQLNGLFSRGVQVDEITIELILTNEIFTTSVVIAYGRLFAGTTNTTQLDDRKIPAALRPAHDEIIGLRNKRYAHHGAHQTVENRSWLTLEGADVYIEQQIENSMTFGGPRHWAPLFDWLRQHMYDTMKSQLAYLTRVSGLTWKMREGSSPSWME